MTTPYDDGYDCALDAVLRLQRDRIAKLHETLATLPTDLRALLAALRDRHSELAAVAGEASLVAAQLPVDPFHGEGEALLEAARAAVTSDDRRARVVLAAVVACIDEARARAAERE